MMSRFLVTPSLYSAWLYYRMGEEATAEDFLKTLRKDKEPPNELMMRGIHFERHVDKFCDGDAVSGDADYVACVAAAGQIVKGGVRQEKVYADMQIGPYPILAYGRADWIKRDYAYDIKFAGAYEIGKYIDSIQHLVYMKCAGLPHFAYLITDGHHFYREDYSWSPGSEKLLESRIHEMLDDIFAHAEFARTFDDNWTAYERRVA